MPSTNLLTGIARNHAYEQRYDDSAFRRIGDPMLELEAARMKFPEDTNTVPADRASDPVVGERTTDQIEPPATFCGC
jgi:hypothetical protein